MIRIDAKKFAADMAIAKIRLGTLVMAALDRSTRQAADFAKASSLFKRRTWALHKSIEPKVGGKYFGSVSAGAKHARWVEYGTKPHIIRAKRAKALRFEQNGTVRFAKWVKHPGTKPRPFMQRARDKAEPLFHRLCSEVIDRLF